MYAERVNQLIEDGLWLRLSGDVDGARRLFEQALKLDPKNPRVLELLDNHPGLLARMVLPVTGGRWSR